VAHTRLTLDIATAAAKAHKGAARGLTVAAEHVLQESRVVVPLEEGTLERSGRVDVDEAGLEAAVSYGDGGDTSYVKSADRTAGYDGTFDLGDVAIIQHEDLTFAHAPGRTAKYLEGPLMANMDQVLAIEAAHIRRALK
jgi:hypothetical protein